MGSTGLQSNAAPNNPGTAGGIFVPLMASTACAASNAWVSSGVIDVTDARYLRVAISVAGAAVGNIVSVMPLFAWTTERPVAASAATDNWFTVPVSVVRNRPLVLQTMPTAGATEDQRISWLLNVADVRWVQFLYAQADGGVVPSVAIAYAVAC